jgi:hypothetical protein
MRGTWNLSLLGLQLAPSAGRKAMTNPGDEQSAEMLHARWRSARRSIFSCVIGAMVLVACSDHPVAPQTGSLKISIETVGGDFDDDGYSLVVGSGQPMPVGAGAIIILDRLSAGTYTATLSGLADNCTLEGTPSRSIAVPSGGTADIRFAVTCVATGIKITTQTTGPDQPLGGYVVETGERSVAIPANGNVLVGRLATGSHTVSLSVAANCTVPGGTVRAVNVSHRAVTDVTFEVICVPLDRPIAFQRDTLPGFTRETAILLAAPDGSGAERVAVGNSPAWSPDGKRLAYSNTECDDFYYYFGGSCTGGLVILNMETRTESFAGDSKLGVDPAWSPDGKLIAFIRYGTSTNATLEVTGFDGTSAVTLTPQGMVANHPSWSPDGQRITFGCSLQICVVNRDGSGLVQLSSSGQFIYDRNPAWSPDGSKIAFTTNRFLGGTAIAVMNADGSDVTRLTEGDQPAWSPDGSKLVFSRIDGLFTVGSDGANITRLTTGPHSAPAWRP